MAKKPIQVRIDEKLKKRVEKIFENLGLDTASAVRIFFMKVVQMGGIPFDVRDDSYCEIDEDPAVVGSHD